MTLTVREPAPKTGEGRRFGTGRCLTALGTLACLGSALALGAPASAQEPTFALDEIIVTAQFRAQNLQQTPIAITAVTGAMMEARSQYDISQVANQAPNVMLKPQAAAFGPSLAASIRGIGQYDFNPALEPGVGVYVDDVYYATLTGSVFDLLDLDRVEIARGPQGTLAGRNSIGGAVKLYSKMPTGEGGGFVAASYGSRDRLDFRGSADFAISESVFARISGVSKNQDGYIQRLDYGCMFPASGIPPIKSVTTDCVLAKESQVNYDGVRGILRFDNGGPLDVNIIADFTHEDRTPAGSVLLYANNTGTNIRLPSAPTIPYDSRFVVGPKGYYNYGTFFSPVSTHTGPVGTVPLSETRSDGRLKHTAWGVSTQANWDVSDTLQVQSITAYRTYDTYFSNDDDLSPLAIGNGQGTLDFWSFSQELRLNGSFGANNEIEWTVGGFYMDQKSVYATYQDLRYAPVPLQFQGDDPVNADSKAVFAHLSWAATDRLTLIGGLRYTDESKDYTFVRLNKDGTVNTFLDSPNNPIRLNGYTGTYSGDRVDYRATAQYQWTDEFMTYAQVSTGFKGGGIGPRPFATAQVQPFGPETLRSYEIGFKGDLMDNRVRFNAAAFYGEYKDIILTLLSCPQFAAGPCALPQNAGDAHIKGVELETSIRPVDGLSIDGSISYLDFQYTNINPQAGVPDDPNTTANEARGVQLWYKTPYTPKWKWSAGIQYDAEVGNMGTLTPRFDIAYQGDLFTNAVNSNFNAIDGYTLANARLTWRSPDEVWEASFEVTNLFDKYYFLTKFDLIGAGAGMANGQPGRPREWAITVKRSF